MRRVKPSIVVLGAGAVGSTLAAALAESGLPPVLVESDSRRLDQVRREGVQVTGDACFSARFGTVLASVEELIPGPPVVVLVCTKTWSLRELVPQLARVLPSASLVVSFQNGVGPEDELLRFFPPERVARGVINFAGRVDRATGVVAFHWLESPNYLGPLVEGGSQAVQALAKILSATPISTRAVDAADISSRAVFKTVLSCALNALCATAGITMRQALAYDHTRDLARTLVREALAVAEAAGYCYGDHALERCMEYLESGGDHLPSMCGDLQRGARTEIEHLNGKIVEMGRRFDGLQVGANLFFTAMVISREILSGVRRADEIPEYLRGGLDEVASPDRLSAAG